MTGEQANHDHHWIETACAPCDTPILRSQFAFLLSLPLFVSRSLALGAQGTIPCYWPKTAEFFFGQFFLFPYLLARLLYELCLLQTIVLLWPVIGQLSSSSSLINRPGFSRLGECEKKKKTIKSISEKLRKNKWEKNQEKNLTGRDAPTGEWAPGTPTDKLTIVARSTEMKGPEN